MPNTNQDNLTQRLRYTISIYSEETVLTDHGYSGDGDKRYLINESQLMQFFRAPVTFRPEKGLIWQQSDGLSDTYLFDLGKIGQKTIVQRQGKKNKEYKMSIPALLIKATVSNNRVSALDLWAYAGKLKEESVLYEVPLPNIREASMCLGSVDCSVDGSLIETIKRILFDTLFNSHLSHAGKKEMSFKEYYDTYNGKMPFHSLNKLGYAAKILNEPR